MDIEGFAVDSSWLWVVGSHSLKREKPDPLGQDRDESLAELTGIDRDPNRYFLGRVPMSSRLCRNGCAGY